MNTLLDKLRKSAMLDGKNIWEIIWSKDEECVYYIMENKEKKTTTAQGAEIVKSEKLDNNTEVVTVNVPRETYIQRKEQAKSVSYALSAMKNHIETLLKAGLITDKEANEIEEIRKKGAIKYINDKFGV